MNNKKKIIIWILVIVLLVAAGYGMYRWSIELTATEKYSQEGDYTKYRTYKDGEITELNIPNLHDYGYCSLADVPYNNPSDTMAHRFEHIKAAFYDNVNSSYIVTSRDSSVAYGMSRKDFVNRVNEGLETLKSDEYEITFAIFEENSIEAVEGWLKDTLANLTGSSQYGRYAAYKPWDQKSIPWKSFSAFEKSISPKEYIEPQAIQKSGLKLKVENPVIQKFVAEYADILYYIEIDADVTTEKKPKNIKDDWIPEEGKTKKISFVLCAEILNHTANQVQVYDIAVKGYN